MRVVCEKELRQHCDETWVDDAGNLVGLILGQKKETTYMANSAMLPMMEMDEIAMAVRTINDDGTLQVSALGGVNPVNFGM